MYRDNYFLNLNASEFYGKFPYLNDAYDQALF